MGTVAGTPALQPAPQRHGSRGGEGEEGEEVDVRANGEAAREAKGFGEQEDQAVHGEAEGPTEGQHKGLRPRLGNGNLCFLKGWKKNKFQADCRTDYHWGLYVANKVFQYLQESILFA